LSEEQALDNELGNEKMSGQLDGFSTATEMLLSFAEIGWI
jgi:hypothetical protein